MTYQSSVPTCQKIHKLIGQIPVGKVATYGQIAELAGKGCSTRQVVWALRSSSPSDNLPWHRVINSKGGISLRRGGGHERQRRLLEQEGVPFTAKGLVDLSHYRWQPQTQQEEAIFDRFRPWIDPSGKSSREAGEEEMAP